MLKSTTVKIDTLISNYLNGNLKDAAARLRALTKLELAELLVDGWQVSAGRRFIGNSSDWTDFQAWVIRVLSWRNDGM